MTCPKCKSNNTTAQIITHSKLKTAHHNILWWIFIGVWWVPLKWFFLFFPALVVKIFAPKRQKLKQKDVTMWVCQDCGYTWKA